MLRRMMLVPIVGAIALLMSAGPALAAPEVPNVTPFEVTIPAGDLCSFEVIIAGRNGQVERTTLPDGTVILTGPFVATFTNTTNDRSATFNVSGPMFTSGTTQVIVGTAVVLLFNEFAPPGPGIIATKGRGTIENLDFNIDTFKGKTSDVCQQLR